MYRTDADGSVAVMPTPDPIGTPGYYGPGNPSVGQQATVVSHEHLNAMQEEIAAVVEDAGLALDKDDNAQLLAAIRLLTGVPSNPDPVTTTDATVTDLATVAVAEGELLMVEASVVGRKSDGSAFYAGKIVGTFYRNTGGDVTQLGGASVTDEVNDSEWGGIDLAADTVNQTVDLTCEGLAATTISWKASVKVTKLTA
ncbi:MAG TPA: hypothetical protein PLY45_00365 [bacterium]|nr:hypothetical protein [bacterium]